jgi:hypothetical protein
MSKHIRYCSCSGSVIFTGDKSVLPIYNVLVVEHYCPLVCMSGLTSVSFRKIVVRYGEMNIAKILGGKLYACIHCPD